MFQATFKLFKIRGIQIGINWSWLIIFGLIAWSLGSGVFPATTPGLSSTAYVGMAAAATLLFFASLLLHELGHAVRAEHEGMQIEGITLWLLGGVAQFKSVFPSAGAELRVALAGPVTTFIIAAGTLTAAEFFALPAAIGGVVAWLGLINVILLGFNMLPGFPLDGGRVLRATLWHFKADFARATVIAGAVGRFFGGFLIVGGIVGFLLAGMADGLWLALIGWFVSAAARSEVQVALVRESLGGMTVASAMVRNPKTTLADMTLQEFINQLFTPRQHATYPVVDPTGKPLGILPTRGILTTYRGRYDDVTVGSRMLPLAEAPVVRDDDELQDAFMVLLQSGLGRALVIRDDQLVGLLSITDLRRFVDAHTPTR